MGVSASTHQSNSALHFAEIMEKEWWKTQLAVDIHENLREKETRLPTFTSASPQLKLRRYLVDWLAVICESVKSSHGVLHLAIFLMDQFMDKFDIQEPQLHLVALTCLLLAAKFEENEDKIPSIATLNACVHNVFSRNEFQEMELMLLKFFAWRMDFPTSAHFMDFYVAHSVSPQDCQGGRALTDCSKPKIYMKKYVYYFLEISLQDYRFLSFKPSVIAASAVAASRVCLHLSPTWTPCLIEVTFFTWEEISLCVDMMIRAHDADEKAMSRQNKTAKG